jgi:hypothetical protein
MAARGPRLGEKTQRPVPVTYEEVSMSVELNEEAGGKIVVVKLSEKLTKEDYEHFVPEMNRLVKQHGKVRLLVEMHNFHGWTMSALWEDIKFDMAHFKDIERLALVGESKWESGMAGFCKPFTSAKVKYFDTSKSTEALAWIRSAEPA